MDKMEIQEKIVAILARHTSIERSAFTPEKNLKLDLGLDSLDVAEIVYEMEETFGISISDESGGKFKGSPIRSTSCAKRWRNRPKMGYPSRKDS